MPADDSMLSERQKHYIDPELDVLNHYQLAKEFLERNPAYYESSTGKWYTFDTYYKEYPDSELFKEVAHQLAQRASISCIKGTIECLRNEADLISLSPSPNLIPFNNGTYCLSTKTLLPFNEKHQLNYQLPRAWNDSLSDFPNINSFLNTLACNNPELKQIFIAICSMVLKRDSKLACVPVLLGTGANGKSVFTNLLMALVGHKNTSSMSLARLNNDRFSTYELLDKTLCIFPDESTYTGKISVFKGITGGDNTTVEQKNKPASSRPIPISMIITSNKPVFVGNQDGALSRRILYVPCDAFIPEDQRRDLLPEFELEAFTTFLMGFDHKPVLIDARKLESIKQITKEYECLGDSVAAFVTERLEPCANNQIQSSVLYDLYRDYCTRNGMQAKSQIRFSKELLEYCTRNRMKGERVNKRTGRFFIGLKIV